MSGDRIEIEAKFYLRHLGDVRRRVLAAGGRLVSPHHLERNERFDTPEGRLSAAGEVLRLRIGERVLLTHKVPLQTPERRREIEVEAGDAAAARAFLQALGYRAVVIYEKYRETFTLDGDQVMLDELPFGCFVEVEGSTEEAAASASSRIGLEWARRVPFSYVDLFDGLRRRLHLSFVNAAFEEFASLPPITAQDLGLLDFQQPA